MLTGSIGMGKRRIAIFIEWSVMAHWNEGFTIGKYLSKECRVCNDMFSHEYRVHGLSPGSFDKQSKSNTQEGDGVPYNLIYLCPLIFIDRIVDELNPERCLSKSEIASLMAPLVRTNVANCCQHLIFIPSHPWHPQLTFTRMK